MGFRDTIEQLAEAAGTYVRSDEVQERLADTKQVAQEQLLKAALKAKQLADSEAGQKVIAKSRELGDEVLGLIAAGDSPPQAAAKTARSHLNPNPNPCEAVQPSPDHSSD